MRFPVDLLKSVVYIGIYVDVHEVDGGEKADMEFAGTGVWISVPSENHGGAYMYLVTAKHIAEDLEGSTWGIRANTTKGEAHIFALDDAKWYYHNDETVDLAVLPCTPPPIIDCTSIPYKHGFASPDLTLLNKTTMEFLDKPVAIGDEIVIIGLLKHAPGDNINTPIARFGNLSLVPTEPIPWGGNLINAYIIESRSIGGLSGSPVFVKVQPETSDDMFLMLGVVRGHWDKNAINTGIAVVEPSHRITEILNQKELVDMRTKLDKESSDYAKKSADEAEAVNDSGTISGDQILKNMLDTPPETHEEMKEK